MLSGGYPMEHVPEGILNNTGSTRDIIANKVQLGSGRTYDIARNVSNKNSTYLFLMYVLNIYSITRKRRKTT